MGFDFEGEIILQSPRPGSDAAAQIVEPGSKLSAEAVLNPLGVNPGDVVTIGETFEYLSYYYYSGSIINKNEYRENGYINNFDWGEHANSYMVESTIYEVQRVFSEVGTHTVTVFNGIYYKDEIETVYDWVETETNPTVSTNISSDTLYTFPYSVGIIAEVPAFSTPGHSQGIVGKEAASIEMSYTDNSDLYFNLIPGNPDTNPSLEITIDSDEANFLRNIFSYDTSARQEMDNRLDRLTELIYNSVNVAKNIFPTTDPASIPSSFVGDISGQETAFSASVSTATTEGGIYTA